MSTIRKPKYNRRMITTEAACCLVSSKPGVAHTTNLMGRFAGLVECRHCDAEYRMEFASNEEARIDRYESRLRTAAQKMINADHIANAQSIVGHTPIISVLGIE